MTLPGATPLRRLCNRPLQSARFLRITTTSGECATDDRGVVVPRCVVQVPHRGLRVGVAHHRRMSASAITRVPNV
jgi:hypothetical protein